MGMIPSLLKGSKQNQLVNEKPDTHLRYILRMIFQVFVGSQFNRMNKPSVRLTPNKIIKSKFLFFLNIFRQLFVVT